MRFFVCAGAQARQLPGEIFARCALALVSASLHASFTKLVHRGVYLCIDILDGFAMRCVVASVVLLSIVAGATEPRDDLKPLGAAAFTCFFRVAVRSLA